MVSGNEKDSTKKGSGVGVGEQMGETSRRKRGQGGETE